MVGDVASVCLAALSKDVRSKSGIVDFISNNSHINTVVAIDASLVVNNKEGQRPCETLIGKTFGQYGASCHTTNLNRPYAQAGIGLVSALERLDFVHDFVLETAKQRSGRWIFEVYPHPAMVRLFELDRIIKYKKGAVADRRHGLRTLATRLINLDGLIQTPILMDLLNFDVNTLRGCKLKQHEDLLDAFFCAYLAWHCWRWGIERNEIFGTIKDGYIVVPALPSVLTKVTEPSHPLL